MENLVHDVVSDYYEPWWISHSEFTPPQNGPCSPAKIELLSNNISEKLGRDVKKIEYLANGVFHTVYSIYFQSEPEAIIRIAFNFKDTERGRAAVMLKMKSEAAVLRLVKMNAPEVPVPSIFYFDPDPSNPIGAPYMVLEKLRGITYGYSNLKGNDMEEFIKSLAQVYVGVFSITLPQIGGYLETSPTGQHIIGPIIDEREENPGGPFNTIEEYLAWLFSSTLDNPRNTRSNNSNVNLPELFDRLSKLAQVLLPLNRDVARFALIHLDPHERNLLVEGTTVTGLIDWETQASLPSYLAARYPGFLECGGIFDERYVIECDLGSSSVCSSSLKSSSSSGSKNMNASMMNSSPMLSLEEKKHLREVFMQAAVNISPEFVEALHQGETLRELLDWLTFAEFDGPCNWKCCEMWERDVHAAMKQ